MECASRQSAQLCFSWRVKAICGCPDDQLQTSSMPRTDPGQFDILARCPRERSGRFCDSKSSATRALRRADGASNAALVPESSFAGSGAGGTAQGRDRAQGRRYSRVLRADASAGCVRRCQLAQEIAEANGFILLIGEIPGIGKWQVPEYYEAHDRWVNAPTEFSLVVILLEGQTAPGLPFLRQLHWIITRDPSSEKDVARLFDAASGGGSSPGDLWRYTSPYRGLAAMEEKDSDYFFGRKRETIDVLLRAAGALDRVPVLIGNSGVI